MMTKTNKMSKELRQQIALHLIENASSYDERSYHADCIDVAWAFAEPGYTLDGDLEIIALANWNAEDRWDPETKKRVPTSDLMPRLSRVLEWLGVTVDWFDMYTRCDDCYGLLRTCADSYFWKFAGVKNNVTGDTLCHKCAKEDPDFIIDAYNGRTDTAITIDGADELLTEAGWSKLPAEYENGLHEGMAADPKVIGKSLRKMGVKDFIFTLDNASQFYVDFSVWVKEEDVDKVKMSQLKHKADVSPAELAKRALQSGSITMVKQSDLLERE